MFSFPIVKILGPSEFASHTFMYLSLQICYYHVMFKVVMGRNI